MTILIRLILAVLVVYRLSMLFTKDDGPFGIFAQGRTWLGLLAGRGKQYDWRWTLAELFNCPYCLALWIAIFICPLVWFPTLVGDVFLSVVGIAGGADTFTQRNMEV